LDLSFTKVKGPGQRRLAGLASLIELDLSNTPLDEDGLEILTSFQQVKLITLNSTCLPLCGFKAFSAAMPNLTTLNLANAKVYGKDGFPIPAQQLLNQVRHLKNLTGLDVSAALVPVAPADMSAQPHASPKQITETDLDPLTRMPQLTWLNLSNNNLTDAALVPIGKLTQLTALGLSGNNELTGKSLNNIHSLNSLEELFLSGIGQPDSKQIVVTNSDIEPFLNLPRKLKVLDLSSTTTVMDASLLKGKDAFLGSIRCLSVADTGVSNEELTAIATLTNLRKLDVSSTTLRINGRPHREERPEVEVAGRHAEAGHGRRGQRPG